MLQLLIQWQIYKLDRLSDYYALYPGITTIQYYYSQVVHRLYLNALRTKCMGTMQCFGCINAWCGSHQLITNRTCQLLFNFSRREWSHFSQFYKNRNCDSGIHIVTILGQEFVKIGHFIPFSNSNSSYNPVQKQVCIYYLLAFHCLQVSDSIIVNLFAI